MVWFPVRFKVKDPHYVVLSNSQKSCYYRYYYLFIAVFCVAQF